MLFGEVVGLFRGLVFWEGAIFAPVFAFDVDAATLHEVTGQAAAGSIVLQRTAAEFWIE